MIEFKFYMIYNKVVYRTEAKLALMSPNALRIDMSRIRLTEGKLTDVEHMITLKYSKEVVRSSSNDYYSIYGGIDNGLTYNGENGYILYFIKENL